MMKWAAVALLTSLTLVLFLAPRPAEAFGPSWRTSSSFAQGRPRP